MKNIFTRGNLPSQINGWLSTLAAVMQAVVSDHGDEERAEVYAKAQSLLLYILSLMV